MKTPETVRSAARRRAGRRLELRHPLLTAQLKQLYIEDTKLRKRYDKHFNARRIEWVRADLAAKYPQEYKSYVKEEIKNVLRKN